jgi:hypothetical protein
MYLHHARLCFVHPQHGAPIWYLDAMHSPDVLMIMMRPLVTFLFLVATVTASAQWVSPVEQSYGPYLAPPADTGPALVASTNSVLLAWSELDPFTRIAEIRVGVLDFDGRLTGAITTLPTLQPVAEAQDPVVATDGETFAVAWQEPEPHRRMAAVALDSKGAPAGEPLPFGGIGTLPSTPLLFWNGEAYQIHGLAFDRSGRPVDPDTNVPAHVRYAAGETLVGMNWTSTPRTYRCGWGIGHGCNWIDPEFIVSWELAPGGSGSRSYRYYSDSRAVTAGDAHDMAIVWRSPTELNGLRVIDGEYHSRFTILEDTAAPEPDGIAFDGERWLVVFTRTGDVWGAFVDRTGRDFAPFPIASTARVERMARVIALAPGRFLVSYLSDLGNDDHRFAGRIVLTEPPPSKRRALR